MDDTYYWRLHPQLLESGRNGHTSVVTENKIIHIGGSGKIDFSQYLNTNFHFTKKFEPKFDYIRDQKVKIFSES